MPTECRPDLFGFAPVEGHEVVAAFDAGAISSDAGALLLGATSISQRCMRFAALVSSSGSASAENLALAQCRLPAPPASWTDGFAEGSVGPRPVRELDYLFGGVGPVGSDRHSAERRFQMSPLRMRMIEDMKLAGLSPGTQATYIDAVRKLAAYYRRSPDQLSEEEVRAYILHLRERGAARGTFKANYYGIQYLYRYTVSRDWALFVKKRSVCRDRSGCPARLPTPRSAGCLAA